MSKDPIINNALQVVEYLQENPDFFARHPHLLDDLQLPHLHGGSVSLVERQLQQFRQQRDVLQSEFSSMLDIAGENSSLFEKVMQFNLTLMATQNEEQALQQMEKQLQKLFAVDCVKLYSFEMPKRSVAGIQQLGMSSRWSRMLESLLQPRTPFCGALEKDWREGLFADNGQVSSACMLPLGEERVWGVLALGRYDLGYENDFGHFFLRLIAQMVTAKLSGVFEDPYQPIVKSNNPQASDESENAPVNRPTEPNEKVVSIARAANKAE